MKILFLANLIPYPLDGGGKIFTYSTIQALSKSNTVDLLCFHEQENVEKGVIELSSYCSRIKVFPIKVTTNENKILMMKKAFYSLFSRYPLAVSKYYSDEMRNQIEESLNMEEYDCVFINILAMSIYCQHIKKVKPNIRIILYEQNCEALIYKRLYLQEHNLLKKLFIGYEYLKLNKFEQRMIHFVDRVIVLSEEDQHNLGLKDAIIIPVGVQPPSYRKIYDNNTHELVRMLFIGTMTWAPNNEGIIWFINKVMPMCRDESKYQLTIVGKNPSQIIRDLVKKYNNIHILGYVENLEEVYENSDVLIVPLLAGSGQRVKIIEAFARAYGVISTTIGAEGLEYKNEENIAIADTPDEFKQKIDKCRNHAYLCKIGTGGKRVFDSLYSTEIVARKLNEEIQ